MSLDERFLNYENGYFTHKSRELDKELMGVEDNNHINASMSSYLRLLSGHFKLPSALRTLKYLIRRYKYVLPFKLHFFMSFHIFVCQHISYYAILHFIQQDSCIQHWWIEFMCSTLPWYTGFCPDCATYWHRPGKKRVYLVLFFSIFSLEIYYNSSVRTTHSKMALQVLLFNLSKNSCFIFLFKIWHFFWKNIMSYMNFYF